MTVLAIFSLLIWTYLLLGHGRFWQYGPLLQAEPQQGQGGPSQGGASQGGASQGDASQGVASQGSASQGGATSLPAGPAVAIVIPARDEAPVIEATLRSLLAQDYRGPVRVILVDDRSTDGTGTIARGLVDPRLTVLTGSPRPAGWSGKLWAVAQGLIAAGDQPFVLLTDADIVHEPGHLHALVTQAQRDDLDLVSEMVALACDSLAERALVPAFVFFFQLLYPFDWVNNPLRSTAAAAGGTILLRRRALVRIGGIEAVRGALIDDVALAAAVKTGGRIWLGHATLARSVRPYPGVTDIWRMVARTAYVQLRYSPLLLIGTTLAMALIWLVPPAAALFAHGTARWCGLLAWAMLAGSYLPTLRRFGCSPLWAPFLPLVAAFYTAATVGSAVNHYTGRGVAWKGRAYRGAGT
jgi:hopene-associated glycosyltransferase HpnB